MIRSPSAALRVRELRAQLPVRDAVGARFALEHQLGGSAPPETLLPAGAWLLIRSLRDPQPRVLSSRAGQVIAPPAWQNAFRSRLENLVTAAARPQRGVIPSEAEAVLFRHLGELLACFAQSWRAGRVPREWWWRSLLGELRPESWVEVWTFHAEALPSALSQLAAHGILEATLTGLRLPEASALIAALVDRFGLDPCLLPDSPMNAWLRPVPDAVPAADSSAPESAPPTVFSSPRSTDGSADAPGEAPVPSLDSPPDAGELFAWLPEVTGPSWSRSALAVVAIGLILERAPQRARAADFGEQLARWMDSVRSAGETVEPTRNPTENSSDAPAARTSWAPVPAAEGVGESATMEPQPGSAEIPESGAHGVIEGGSVSVPEAPSPPVTRTPESDVQRAATRADGDRDWIREPVVREEFVTAAGGLFYLTNVALSLGLYGDFTQPRRPGIELPFWDFLAVIGDRVLGPTFRADPLWESLAAWSGRDVSAPPGSRFLPPADWCLADSWLIPFQDTPVISWLWAKGQLRAWHGAGFVVLDRACASATAAESEVTRWLPEGWTAVRVVDSRQAGPIVPRDPTESETVRQRRALRRWLARLLPYLQARLRCALPALAEVHLLRSVLRQTGRVRCSPTEVVVHFPLASHPLALRLAGLDRDPGWVPAAGRSISFVYD